MIKPSYKFAVKPVVLLLASLPICLTVQAADKTKPAAPLSIAAQQGAELKKQKLIAEHNQQIIDEAKQAVLGTQQALLDLEKNDAPAALIILQEVTKQLDTILVANPALVLVAADIEVDVIDFDGNAAAIAAKVKQAANLLNHGKLQAGRMVADELASEMDITTASIPLTTYPAIIKDAVVQINAGKVKEAAQLLENALNSLVQQTEIIPLPLLRAETLLLEAATLEQKTDLTKAENRDAVLKLTATAKEKLKIAELLGYGSKADYQPFYQVIDNIKDSINTEKSAATWAKIKLALAELKTKITPAAK
ncbi:YfdX family protein [Methylomonas paludis]|uniref:YfdX family protein n=1 Tax=Methylomonas paludis TaxID=1173101 RepID=A0A975RAR2_9GAMM|nr:YfdX family protein [Methylomonas paludis]QWF72422.1 YfdX family protein [Methylomonas paludis]